MKQLPHLLTTMLVGVVAFPWSASSAPIVVEDTVYNAGTHIVPSELSLVTQGNVTIQQDAIVTFVVDESGTITLNDGFVAEPASGGLFVAESRSVLEVLALIGNPSIVDLSGDVKLSSPNPIAGGAFGNGLALDRLSNRMIVRDGGGAFIFSLSGSQWALEQALHSSLLDLTLVTGDVSDSVAIYGEWAVVGNPHANAGLGAIVIFKNVDGQWIEHERIDSPWTEGVSGFGQSVALLNRQLIVGAYRAESVTEATKGVGRGFVFTLSNDTWSDAPQVLYYDTLGDPALIESYNLGTVVDVYENTAVVAEADRRGGELPDLPQVQVYDKAGAIWGAADTLVDLDEPAQPNPLFGWSVSVSGDYLAIGAPYRDELGFQDGGAVFIYRKSNGLWTEYQKLVAWDVKQGTRFGYSVDLYGDTLVVSRMADGASYYVFRLDQRAQSWRLMRTLDLDPDDLGEDYRVAVGKDYVVLARPSDSLVVDGAIVASAGSINFFKLDQPSTPPDGGLPAYNHLPIAFADTIVLSEASGTGTTNVVANDSDGDGGSPVAIAYPSVAGSYGTLSIAGDGTATYALDLASVKDRHPDDPSLNETFTYQVTDGVAHANGQIGVTISSFLNHQPELTGSPLETIEATQNEPIVPIDIPAFADPEGRALSGYIVEPELSWLLVSGDQLVGTPDTAGSFDFTVQAIDDLGSASEPLPFTINVEPSIGTDTTPPSPPSNLVASNVSTGSLDLTWTASTDDVGVDYYEVKRGGVVVGTPSTNAFLDTPLEASTTYEYEVIAVDQSGNVSEAATLTVTTLDLDSDDDGMPDSYEIEFGLDPSDPGDAESDSDGDGLSALREYQLSTDPLSADSDADGITDGWEVFFGLDPTTDDSGFDADGDGATNLQEFVNGTQPSWPDNPVVRLKVHTLLK